MKKQLMSLLLALLMCYALILPASAASVQKSGTTPVKMTVETPVPSYTLSVPEKVEFNYVTDQAEYEFGEVKIKDAENFVRNTSGVTLSIRHTPFTLEGTETTRKYTLAFYCKLRSRLSNTAASYGAYGDPHYEEVLEFEKFNENNPTYSHTFHPCDSSYEELETCPGCDNTTNSHFYAFHYYQTMKLKLKLADPTVRPADGVYTSTVTFNASLSY